MEATFADSLKSLRAARGLSQQQLATKLFVNRSTVARWESGDRVPDLALIPRIAACLGVDAATMLSAVQAGEAPVVIVVDDERVALAGAISVLEEALPGAIIIGFEKSSDALAYAHSNPIAIGFLDIEIGLTSGLDLCRDLLKACPRANIVFLSAHREYSFDAWEAGACGFLLKPITAETARSQLTRLRYPVTGLITTPQASEYQ